MNSRFSYVTQGWNDSIYIFCELLKNKRLYNLKLEQEMRTLTCVSANLAL